VYKHGKVLRCRLSFCTWHQRQSLNELAAMFAAKPTAAASRCRFPTLHQHLGNNNAFGAPPVGQPRAFGDDGMFPSAGTSPVPMRKNGRRGSNENMFALSGALAPPHLNSLCPSGAKNSSELISKANIDLSFGSDGKHLTRPVFGNFSESMPTNYKGKPNQGHLGGSQNMAFDTDSLGSPVGLFQMTDYSETPTPPSRASQQITKRSRSFLPTIQEDEENADGEEESAFADAFTVLPKI
jgi:hypothetical protein